MSTVLAYTSPARGHLYPITPALLELRRRGHDVRLRTLSSEVAKAHELGLDAEPIDGAIEERVLDDWKGSSNTDRLERALRTFVDRGHHDGPDLEAAIEAERPDILLVDINTWGAGAVAERSGLPWATFSPLFTFCPAPGVPPYGPGLKPMRGPLGRLRDAALWRLVERTLNRAVLDDLNALRTGLGAPALDSIVRLPLTAPRMLYLTVPELEYPRPRWPSSFRFVGPGVWSPPAEAPGWLDEIDRPLVLVTGSTEYQNDEELISTALEALAGEDVAVVVTTGGSDPAMFEPPANARVERFASHAPLLERAAAVICHGGMGITQKALSYAVPPCIVAWGRDQLEVGRRVEAAGAGTMLTRRKLSAARLREALAAARRRRDGASRIAAAVERSPGAAGAADELESLAPVPA